MAESPTNRTLKRLRGDGWTCEVVEKWIPHTRVTKDLFGFIDIIALKPGETLAIQATSDDGGSHGPNRVRKILAADNFAAVADAGWDIQVWAWWRNAKGVWAPRITIVTPNL